MKIMTQKNKHRLILRLKCEDIILYLATIYFMGTLLLFTENESLKTVLDAVQLVLLMCIGLIFSLQKVSRKKMLVRIAVVVVFVISSLTSGVIPYLKYALVLMVGMYCCWDRMYKRLFYLYLWCVVLTFLLGAVGILPSRIVRRGYSTYGFVHANVLALYVLSVLCCYILAYYRQFRLRHYLSLVTTILVVWWVTDSRTTVISMIFLLFMCVLGKWGTALFKKKSILYCVMIILPVLLAIFSYVLSRYHNSSIPLFSMIDLALNGRLAMANKLIDTLAISLFGQKVNITLVENAYLSGIYQFGLIPMLLELLVYMYAIKKSMDERDYGCLACLLTFAVHGLTEASTFGPFNNVALLSVFSRSVVWNHPARGKGISHEDDYHIVSNRITS